MRKYVRKREEKITSLSNLPVKLIKEKKFDEHIKGRKCQKIETIGHKRDSKP
jgi:hypothetical protein